MNMKKYKNIFISIAIIILIAVIIYVFMPSRAATGQNDFMIDENSNLEYYINVMYDGQDEAAVVSGAEGTATAEVFSDYIYVEDKLPEGTTYNGLVLPSGETQESWDCTYGAVEQADATRACSGYVVGAKKENGQCQGVNYDSSTRIVSFVVRGLKAGCKLTVGIKTTTQTLGNNDRIDMFNTAYAWEEKFTAKSNPVHVFMGNINAPTFNTVSYSYAQNNVTGVSMPELPDSETHTPGVDVGVARNPVLEGYEFSGWTTADATVSNGKFTMPNGDVAFTGYFTKKTEYTVTYTTNVATDSTMYVPPAVKSYGVGDNVSIAEIDENYIADGYTFEGWSTNDVSSLSSSTFKSGSFKMPNKDVTITGTFSPKRYNVTYAYKGTVPNNVSPPEGSTYTAGSQVTLPEVTVIPQGYNFLGWYSDDVITMPSEDITIYGEWTQVLPTFAPAITANMTTNVVKSGEAAEFLVTITNNESFAITDVIVNTSLSGCKFKIGEEPDTQMVDTAEIDSIAAGSSITLKAYYSEDLNNSNNEFIKTFTNKFKIINAIGDESHELYTDDEISSTVNFAISDLVLNIATIDESNASLSGSTYKLCTDSAATSCLTSNNEVIKATRFERLGPGTYYLKQTYVPTGYMAFAGPAKIIIANDGSMTSPDLNIAAGSSGSYTATVINEPLNILPETGGIGTIPFIIVGSIIVLGSFGYCVYYLTNKDKKNKSKKEKKGGDNSNDKKNM